jgi:hypothetical protein
VTDERTADTPRSPDPFNLKVRLPKSSRPEAAQRALGVAASVRTFVVRTFVDCRLAACFVFGFADTRGVAGELEHAAVCCFFGSSKSEVGWVVGIGLWVGMGITSGYRVGHNFLCSHDHASVGDVCDLGCACSALLCVDRAGATANTAANTTATINARLVSFPALDMMVSHFVYGLRRGIRRTA